MTDKEYIYNRRNIVETNGNIRFVTRLSEEYPTKLRNIPSKPKGLYVLGKLPDEKIPSIAMIGARVCSEYGKRMARWFGSECGKAGVQVISGMARGIDSISQQAAVEAGGSSFAVLGCGVDVCYPREQAELYRKLQEKGGIISEYEPGSPPLAQQFPARNRIISGLADALLVIEAKEKSGTSITVDMALEQGRDVFVIPGRVTDALSVGCNRLMKQGAGCVLSPEELLAELNQIRGFLTINKSGKEKANFKKNNFVLDKQENMVYASIDLYARNLEEIVGMVQLPVSELVHILLSLELKGLIKETGKNFYVRSE
ncbi:MAG TPA: DNA-processing protein DprA [Lachnospiraceae bacterium]|jgi:DNA processing protein|nr:DNA-processing protein DprA [Lachnospiraceae bacterium]